MTVIYACTDNILDLILIYRNLVLENHGKTLNQLEDEEKELMSSVVRSFLLFYFGGYK